MSDAATYSEWASAAIAYDVKYGLDEWKRRTPSRLYDYAAIARRLNALRELRKKRDVHGLLFALNEGVHGNLCGMGNTMLYAKAKFGTKRLIVDYIEEVVSALEYLAHPRVKGVTIEEKHEFFERAAHCYGRSALLMSGAGSLFHFHIGVVKALWEQGLLPSVVSGASGGAIVAALVGTHSDEELSAIFDPAYIDVEMEREVGVMKYLSFANRRPIPVEDVRKAFERLIPDLTFQEAHELTGIHINIPVAPAELHQKSRLLNATTSPNVLVREAVLASCAVPALFPPVMLAARNEHGEKQPYLPARRWVDGSIAADLPLRRLSRLYGVNHSIVSQTNPLVLPFINDSKDRRSFGDIVQNVCVQTAKEWTLAVAQITKKPLRNQKTLSRVINQMVSVVSQTYTGDINILPSKRYHNLLRVLRPRTKAEALQLITEGERAAWPRIEMIRQQTRIARTLDDVLRKQEARLFRLARGSDPLSP